MSEPIGDPNLVVERDAVPGGGRLVMTEEAVQGWVRAYTTYAATLRELADQIKRRNKTTHFGNLNSLRQLANGYDRLMVGGEGSLHQRLLEYADAANRFAENLQRDWLAIVGEDGQTASSLSSLDPQS